MMRAPTLQSRCAAPVPLLPRCLYRRRRRASAMPPAAAQAANAPACAGGFLDTVPYTPPEWAACLRNPPARRVVLAHTPTPVHAWRLPGAPADVELLVKRDDMTGMELSGNKVRKLEFLLAEAQAQRCDCVVTIGGLQSNHARATAVAARLLGLDAHLILRTSRALVDKDPGAVGNLLVDRLCGAALHLVSREAYGRVGSATLLATLGAQLRAQGLRPFLIPVGGSDATGTWGYIEWARELQAQLAAGALPDFDVLALACGSGGTVAGVTLGAHLAGLRCHVMALGVCDDPAYFREHISRIYDAMGAPADVAAAALARLTLLQARGAGYAQSTAEELRCIAGVARSTGVVLDPVYSGKAVYALLKELNGENAAQYKGKRVLFLHTGGLLGAYDSAQQLLAAAGAATAGPCHVAPLALDADA